MKRLLAISAASAAVLLAAGCSSMPGASHDSGGHMSVSSSASSTEADHSAADVMFAQMMIPHHAQAVEMSTLAETRASDPQIVALAARIKDEQQPEIDQMTLWLEAWGAAVMDRDEVMGMGHGMEGILSDQQMAELEAASGANFDRLYATYMIEHHQGAIDMAQAIVNSANPEVAALGAAIIKGQTAEIAELNAFLAK